MEVITHAIFAFVELQAFSAIIAEHMKQATIQTRATTERSLKRQTARLTKENSGKKAEILQYMFFFEITDAKAIKTKAEITEKR